MDGSTLGFDARPYCAYKRIPIWKAFKGNTEGTVVGLHELTAEVEWGSVVGVEAEIVGKA